jgi:hypothetical protein
LLCCATKEKLPNKEQRNVLMEHGFPQNRASV